MCLSGCLCQGCRLLASWIHFHAGYFLGCRSFPHCYFEWMLFSKELTGPIRVCLAVRVRSLLFWTFSSFKGVFNYLFGHHSPWAGFLGYRLYFFSRNDFYLVYHLSRFFWTKECCFRPCLITWKSSGSDCLFHWRAARFQNSSHACFLESRFTHLSALHLELVSKNCYAMGSYLRESVFLQSLPPPCDLLFTLPALANGSNLWAVVN